MRPANPGLDAALALYRAARLDEALQAFDALVAADPANARALSFRGLTRCQLGDFERGLEDLNAAAGLAPRDAALHANLGMIHYVRNDLDAAQAALKRALVLVPNYPEALANLSLVLRERGDFGGAERAARAALAARPGYHEARINLSYTLLAQGKFAEGWEASCTRPHAHVNLRDPALRVTAPHHTQLPASPGAIIVHGEQGLGDTLFFLRFVPRLRALGHRLAFWGDARLHGMLRRTGHFEHCLMPEAAPGEGLTLLWAGDLPLLLGAASPGEFPPALALQPDGARVARLRARLAAWGGPPYLALTWRAGQSRSGRVVLSKNIEAPALGAALARVPATFVSVQRNPDPDNARALAAALGKPLHDASFANDDLEDALAMMGVVDEYVGVSNTNMHLRAGVGHSAKVLVPFPPEWRWLAAGERSPWFPAWPLYRQAADGSWGGALERLAGSFTGS